MKVLLVNGSPHKEGCTYTALCEVADTLNHENIETEIFWIGNRPIGGCIACLKCREKGACVFDDVVNHFREKAYGADGFVFGSPVHYGAASGNMTAFMDRLFYSELGGNGNKAFYMEPAAAVISARRAGTTATFDQLNKYFTIQETPVVSSRYWNMVHGKTTCQRVGTKVCKKCKLQKTVKKTDHKWETITSKVPVVTDVLFESWCGDEFTPDATIKLSDYIPAQQLARVRVTADYDILGLPEGTEDTEEAFIIHQRGGNFILSPSDCL